MSNDAPDRRQFLKKALIAGVAAGVPSAQAQTTTAHDIASRPEDHRGYGERSHYDTVQRWPVEPNTQKPGEVRLRR